MDNDVRIYRPRSLDQFIGQNLVRKNLRVFIESAKERETSLDHVLLAGPPGLGQSASRGESAQVLSHPGLEKREGEGALGSVAASLRSFAWEKTGTMYWKSWIHRVIRFRSSLGVCLVRR